MNRSATSSFLANLLTGSILVAAAFGACSAHATPVAYGAALANPTTVIDFTGVGTDVAVDTLYAAEGVTFSGLYGTSYFGSGYKGTDAPAAVNYLSDNSNTTFPITLSFASPVAAAQFYLVTDGYGTTITSWLDGVAVETVKAKNYVESGLDYFGFSDSLFNAITLDVSVTGTAIIDNLQIEATTSSDVPEPGSITILLAGMAALMIVGSRRVI